MMSIELVVFLRLVVRFSYRFVLFRILFIRKCSNSPIASSLTMGRLRVLVLQSMSDPKNVMDESAARALVYIVAAIMLLAMTFLIGLFLASYLDAPDSQVPQQDDTAVVLLEPESAPSHWSFPWVHRAGE